MPIDHRIRLRGAWDWLTTVGEVEHARRVDLPTTRAADLAGPGRLVRRFGRPPVDPATEAVRLELVDVPGLVAVALNGRSLGGPPGGASAWSVALGDALLARNVVVLDVAPMTPGTVLPPDGWGSIALVIGPR